MMRMTVLATSLILCACSGVRSNGNVGDRDVVVDGTGIAWLDLTNYEFDGAGVELRELEPDSIRLFLLFSGAVFDPSEDFQSLPAAERLQIENDFARHDRLTVQIRRGDRLAGGDVLEFSTVDPVFSPTGPFVESSFLEIREAQVDGEFPDDVPFLGQQQQLTYEVTTFELPDEGGSGRVSGHIELDIARGEGVGAEGNLEVFFDIPLLQERRAECNFGLRAGAADPCTLTF